MRKFTLLALMMLGVNAVKTTAQTMRLSEVHRSYYFTVAGGWSPFDSVQLKYPSNNGATSVDFDANKVKADSAYFLRYISGNYQPQKIETKTFDIQGRIIEKIIHTYNNPNYEPTERYAYSYNGNNDETEELTQMYNSGNWENYYKVTRTFDVNNNMTHLLNESWLNGAWVNSQQRAYTYDVNNNMVTYKFMMWNSGTSAWDSNYYQHFYYTNNLEDSVYTYGWQSGWVPQGRYYCTYDVNNDNTHRLHQNWNAGTSTWENGLQTFTHYVNHLPVIDTTMNWPANIGNWRYNYRYGYTYNTDGNMLTYYYQDWDTTNAVFVNNILDSSTFNGLYKTMRRSYTWDNVTNSYGATDYDAITKYYYQPYTADVKSVEKTAGTLTIYPVPTRNNLNIKMQWKEAQDFTIAIYDMQGRLIKQTGEKATKEFVKNISVNGLPAGNYILKVRGKDATVQEQFVIMD